MKIKFKAFLYLLQSIELATPETKTPKKPLVIYRGVSIELTDVTFKIAIRQLFELEILEAEPGGKIGVCGDGSNLFTSLLSKIITQTTGHIKLNGNAFTEHISSTLLFGFVPYDPKIDKVTIRQV